MHFLARKLSIRLSVVICLLLLRPCILVLTAGLDQPSYGRSSAIESIDDGMAFLRLSVTRKTLFQAPPPHDSVHAVIPTKGAQLEIFSTPAEAPSLRSGVTRSSILAFVAPRSPPHAFA